MDRKLYILGTGSIIFVVLAAAVIWHNPWLAAVDEAVLHGAVAVRSPGLTAFMKVATVLGTWVAYLVVLAAGLGWRRQRGLRYVIIALVSLALAQFTRTLVNVLVHRPRPPQSDWLVHANLYAFPSGHTVVAGVGFGLAAWLIWLADKRAGVVAAVVAGVLTLLVATSRVYLGVHWASDVTASTAFAVVWITLTLIIAAIDQSIQ